MNIGLIILLSLVIMLNACKQDDSFTSPEADEDIRLSFEIEDYRRYPKPDSLSFNEFFFPPTGLKDKVWGESYELDLLRGEWIELSSKLGVSYNVSARENAVWADPFTANVYISAHKGLIEFDAQKSASKSLNLDHVCSFLAFKDFIFLGTSNGLHKYFRGTGQIVRAENLPDNIWVSEIHALSDDSVRLSTFDDDIVYHIRKSQATKKTRIETSNHNDVSNISRALPQTGLPYQGIEDDSLTWFHNNANVYFKDGKKFFYFNKLDSGYLRQLQVDSKYVYLLFNHQFMILSKAFVINHAELFDANSYQNELKAIYTLSYYGLSLHNLIARIDSVQDIYRNSKHPDIVNRVMELNNTIGSSISTTQFRQEVERSIQKESLPEKFKKPALIALIQYYTVRGQLNKSLQYYKKLIQAFPDYTNLDAMINWVSHVNTSMDSIEHLTVDPDEKLYFLALQKEKLVEHVHWFGESYRDDSIVADTYNEILAKYPNSEFADNAAFYLTHRKYRYDEGSMDSQEGINDYERFIKKYPQSELKIDAILNIVDMYVDFGGDAKTHVKMLEKAQNKLSLLTAQVMNEKQKQRFSEYKLVVDSKIKNEVGQ